jgi:hypothetical protein
MNRLTQRLDKIKGLRSSDEEQSMMRTIAAAGVLGLAASVAFTAPALAGGGLEQSDGTGYGISVKVTVGGTDAKVVSSVGGGISVPPSCWWKSYNPDIGGNDARTPDGFKKFYDESIPMLSGHAAAGRLAMPSYDEVQRVTEAAKNGEKYRWYTLDHQPGVDCVKSGFTKSGGIYMGTEIGVAFAAFLDGEVPPPYVDPEQLATALWDAAEQGLALPAIDRNPKVAKNGGATLVNVPTWFWVTNPAGSLADDGVIDLTATAGGTTVRLHATSSGVDFTSPQGTTSCTAAQAKVKGPSCAITFSKSSTGWPVTASIGWSGNWTGPNGTGGALPQIFRASTINVPVVEVQVPNR